MNEIEKMQNEIISSIFPSTTEMIVFSILVIFAIIILKIYLKKVEVKISKLMTSKKENKDSNELLKETKNMLLMMFKGKGFLLENINIKGNIAEYILILKTGVFVITTHKYNGNIYGTKNQFYWFCKTQKSFKFINPWIKLQEIDDELKKREIKKNHMIAAFIGNVDFKTNVPHGTIEIESLIDYIESCEHNILTDIEMTHIQNILKTSNL